MKDGAGVTMSLMLKLCKPDLGFLCGATACLVVAAVGQSYVPSLTGDIVVSYEKTVDDDG